MMEYQYVRSHTDHLNEVLRSLVDKGWEVHTIHFAEGGVVANILFMRPEHVRNVEKHLSYTEEVRRRFAATMPDEFPEAFAEVLAEGYVEEYRRMAGGAVVAPEEDPR